MQSSIHERVRRINSIKFVYRVVVVNRRGNLRWAVDALQIAFGYRKWIWKQRMGMVQSAFGDNVITSNSSNKKYDRLRVCFFISLIM